LRSDSVLKQSAVNGVEAAVEAEVNSGGSGEVKIAVEAETANSPARIAVTALFISADLSLLAMI
jgi:hypothetical protein